MKLIVAAIVIFEVNFALGAFRKFSEKKNIKKIFLDNRDFIFLNIASVIQPCSSSSGPDACISNVLERIKSSLAKGDFGQGYVTPQMEPMFIDLMQITGPELNINMTNLYVKGATTYKVVSVK